MNPQIYLLDEPSSNLDMRSIQELGEHLRLIKSQGKTILIAEHRLYYLMDLVDRIVYLEHGKIMQVFTPEAFRQLSEDIPGNRRDWGCSADSSGSGLSPPRSRSCAHLW